jgi:hypothetical protein
MTNIIGWFKGLAFVLTNAGEFARQQQEVNALRQSVEEQKHIINRLSVMLKHDDVSITVSEKAIEEHFDVLVSKSVMKWLANWADDLDFVKPSDLEDAVSSAIDDYDFSDAVDRCVEDKDWDYELRHSLDWDKVAERVAEKLDWETIVSDNDLITRSDYDFDDMMLKSEHMSEDDIVTRDELSDMVVGETKRDWFVQTIRDAVLSELQSIKEHPVLVRNTVEVIDPDKVKPVISTAVKDIIFSMLLQSYEMANQHQQKGDSNV